MSKQPYPNAVTPLIRPLSPADLEAVVHLSLLAWQPVFISFESILGPPVFGHLYQPDWRTARANNGTTLRAVRSGSGCQADHLKVIGPSFVPST